MADTIALENAVRGLHESGQRIQRHREAVEEMEQRPMAERLAKLESARSKRMAAEGITEEDVYETRQNGAGLGD